MKTILTILLGLIIYITPLLSQNETEIRTDGLIIPRVDRNTVNNPTAGHLVYDFVSDQFWYYTGTEWKSVNTDDQTLKD
ncbi:MAG: hypothetical protein EBS24_08795, partial [Chitinophagia bacterium]|nr:hypothetical protein [Chitinophagia bacterium]